MRRLWTIAVMVALAGSAFAQTTPGSQANPIKGGSEILQVSRNVSNGAMAQGRVMYYECGTQKTQVVKDRKVAGALVPTTTGCDELQGLATLTLDGTYNHWLRVSPTAVGARNFQGMHTMTLVLRDAAGAVVASLACEGSNGVGTHRNPLAACENCADANHFEGRFKGAIETGAYNGARVWGTYAGDFGADPVPNDATWTFKLALDGVALRACEARTKAADLPGDPFVDPAFRP